MIDKFIKGVLGIGWGISILLLIMVVIQGRLYRVMIPKKPLIVVSDFWCPYVCHPISPNPGYVIEIIEEIFGNRLGFSVEYRLTSWDLALSGTRSGEYDIVVGIDKSEGHGLIVPTTEVGVSRYGLFVDKRLTPTSLQDFEDYRLGAVVDYSPGINHDILNLLDILKVKDKICYFRGDEAIVDLKRAIDTQAIDFVYEDTIVWQYIDSNQSTKLFSLDKISELIYIGIVNKDYDIPFLSIQFNKQFNNIRADGILANILKKYHLNDWRRYEY